MTILGWSWGSRRAYAKTSTAIYAMPPDAEIAPPSQRGQKRTTPLEASENREALFLDTLTLVRDTGKD